jgi:hypothetical protein
MVKRVQTKQELFELLDTVFSQENALIVEVQDDQVTIRRKKKGVVAATRGTIRGLDNETLRKIAESEEYGEFGIPCLLPNESDRRPHLEN